MTFLDEDLCIIDCTQNNFELLIVLPPAGITGVHHHIQFTWCLDLTHTLLW